MKFFKKYKDIWKWSELWCRRISDKPIQRTNVELPIRIPNIVVREECKGTIVLTVQSYGAVVSACRSLKFTVILT